MKKILLVLTSMLAFSVMVPAQAAESTLTVKAGASGYMYCPHTFYVYDRNDYITQYRMDWTPNGICPSQY